MDYRSICLSLVKANSENEVIDILNDVGFWKDENSWQFFGQRENNYGDIGNQQSKADGALVEKIVNSVDAVLMAEYQVKKNTEQKFKTPQSIQEALEQFYNIDEGKLSNLSSRERTALSNKISIVATGSKTNPCYSIIDLGEGQTPLNMPNTLLSLGASNKLRIPFVQGKFNMGGTGVLRFCGEKNIQLILSKRHPEIANFENDTSKTLWGFTIIRRENPTNEIRSSTFKYLAPNNEVLSFSADTLQLLPGDFPSALGKEMAWGTFIKLYEYQAGNLKTIITLNMLYRLSLLLPQIALPIRLYERRNEYKANTYETTLSGLEVRLEEDKSSNLEENFPTSGSITVNREKLKYSVFVFKKGKNETYKNNEGIIFTINGQTHGTLSKSFFTRKNVGLSYLADSILVIVDCSEFSGRARENLFKNDRETLITCPLRAEIENFLEQELKSHPGLRLLKEKRRREEIKDKLEESKPLADLLNDIIKRSPTLSQLFLKGMRISNPFNLSKAATANDFKGKEFPTFFTLVKKFELAKPKIANFDSNFRIQYKTDVSNDYFDRSKNPGIFKLFVNGNEFENFSINLWNGIATLSILSKNLQKDSEVKFSSIIQDINNMALPFKEDFYVIFEKIDKKNGSNGQRKKPSGGRGEDNKDIDGLAMPKILEVNKTDWNNYSFDESSALRIKGSKEDGYDFYINIDNCHLLTEMKYSSNEEYELIKAQYKYGMVLIGLSILNSETDDDAIEGDIFDSIFELTKRISPILLPMISYLGALEMSDTKELNQFS